MRNLFAIFIGKLTYWGSQILHLGAGGTWPGEVVLAINLHILHTLVSQLRKGVIIVAGTNGKTTTTLMLKQILEKNEEIVIHNQTGANLLNGIVSAFIKHVRWYGQVHADWGIFEVDENSLPSVIKELPTANYELRTVIVLLNLFRDQLDRYGELDVVVEKWEKALSGLVVGSQKLEVGNSENLTLILNADDPQIAHLGMLPLLTKKRVGVRLKTVYFGVNDKNKFLKQKEHATDSIFCLNCGARLSYAGIYYSHIGIWSCEHCGEKRPKTQFSKWSSPLPGIYNLYNALAAVSVAKTLAYSDTTITNALKDFQPAFGRQEELQINSKKIKLFLSKNPAGFNQSLRTVIELGAKNILLVLNDRIPDGRDVSWIWDVDFEMISKNINIVVSGDRVYDLGLRIKYANLEKKTFVEPKLEKAIKLSLDNIPVGETLYILSTYSAMLEVRKILTGRKIL